jgi:hypothetical protein
MSMKTLSGVGFMYGERHGSTEKPFPLVPKTSVSHVDMCGS